MKDKNTGLDRWATVIRSPYECVFSRKIDGCVILELLKINLQNIMNAICFNLRKFTVIKLHF